jgi:alginate O-acetyltransferase complex protein AlgJ
MNRIHHRYSIVLIILFCMMISFVMMNDVFQFYQPPSILKVENRNLAKKPFFIPANLDPYPKAYDKFYNDRFPYRTNLIKNYAYYIGLKFYRQSPFPEKVSIGRDGWLFYGKEKPFYLGTFPMNRSQVLQTVHEIHNRALFFHQRGIRFYFAVPPMKQEIYSENLPPDYYRSDKPTVTEQIIEEVKKDTLVRFIDLKKALLSAKATGRLYYKTDNHWNQWGGYFGYKAILDRMSRDYPSLRTLDTSDFRIEMKTIKGKNLAQMMNLSDFIQEEDPTPIMKSPRAKVAKSRGYTARPGFWYPQEFELDREIDDKRLPSIIIVRDSYFYGIMNYILENFRQTVVLYDSGHYGTWDDIMAKEHPDLVLYMIYEPLLPNLVGLNW